jgi:hypothetical protein
LENFSSLTACKGLNFPLPQAYSEVVPLKAILVAMLVLVGLAASVVYAEDSGGFVKPGTIVVAKDIMHKTVGGGADGSIYGAGSITQKVGEGQGGSPALNFVSDGGKTDGGDPLLSYYSPPKTVGGEGGNICVLDIGGVIGGGPDKLLIED